MTDYGQFYGYNKEGKYVLGGEYSSRADALNAKKRKQTKTLKDVQQILILKR